MMESVVDYIIHNLCLGLTLSLASIAIIYCTWRYTFFIRRGIPGPLPVPVFGNVIDWRKGIHNALDAYLRVYGDCCGFYKFFTPSMVASDPEVIKQIMVTHFDRFYNRDVIPVSNPSVSSALFLSRDEQWKKIRLALTPAFSSKKIKMMTQMIKQPADRLVEKISDICGGRRSGAFECREVFGAYIMEKIALLAFGLQIDAQNEDDPFLANAKRFFASIDFTSPTMLLTTIFPACGKMLRWFGISNYPEDVMEFFEGIITRAIELRKGKGTEERVDFLQIVVNAADDNYHDDDEDNDEDNDDGGKRSHTTMNSGNGACKSKREPLTKQELMSQAMAFFVAGYETTAAALCFTCYLLATNPDQQQRLIDEIERVVPTAADVTYDKLNQLTFLDCVINEALRLYPPGTVLSRECKQTTVINGHTFPSGVTVFIPVWSVHHDPKYWPDPEGFDPDRFSKARQSEHHPFAWLPFGGGPKACIGLRFAMMQMKTALVGVLRKFRLETAPETEIPPVLGTKEFLTPPNGITLRAVKRMTE